MNPILKGFLISISIIIGFLLVNFAIVAFLSEVLNDQNSPWIFLIVMGVGMPIIVITLIITGLYKYFKLKSKVALIHRLIRNYDKQLQSFHTSGTYTEFKLKNRLNLGKNHRVQIKNKITHANDYNLESESLWQYVEVGYGYKIPITAIINPKKRGNKKSKFI